MKKWQILTLGLLVCLTYQNCDKGPGTNFSEAEDSLLNSNNSASPIKLRTALNTPADFGILLKQPANVTRVEIISSNGASRSGSFKVTNLAQLKMNFAPKLGFRGSEDLIAKLYDRYGNQVDVSVHVTVANPLEDLQPALAVRGIGCVQCHTQLASNLITDFGYQGDGQGNDYFFGGNFPAQSWWNSGSIYGDHANNFKTLTMSAGKNIIVPKANLSSYVSSASGASTLAQYIQSQLNASIDSVTQQTKILEKKSVYIGAPTDAQLVTAFGATLSDRIKYFKDDTDSVELSGLSDQNNFIKNSGVLNCEGDLLLKGPVHFENLHLSSRTGCRIYIIGSFFDSGPIVFDNLDATRNLQISSSRSISLGLGEVKKSGAFCEPSSNWATAPSDPSYSQASSLLTRYRDIWTLPSHMVRANTNANANGAGIVAEANIIQASSGNMADASCRPEGRDVSFDHILLNAPIVQSRYRGNFSGTIIAEYALMGLNTFKFQYDPVFDGVPVLPFLDQGVYLNVVDF